MINTKNAIATASGVSEKPQTEDHSDPKFAVFTSQGGVNTQPSCTMNDLGVCSSDYNVSKEGIGVGGYDKSFTVN